jgi:hypothetical protein
MIDKTMSKYNPAKVLSIRFTKTAPERHIHTSMFIMKRRTKIILFLLIYIIIGVKYFKRRRKI